MKDKNGNQDYPNRRLIRIGYEELRDYIIIYGESVIRKPPGINLFYRLGMVGWLEECRKLPRLQYNDNIEMTGTNTQDVAEMVRSNSREQVVNLLSNMILAIAG
ncbi:hypothetical protein [Desulfobacula sp.]|uniref:hypothetical protein n=1 Tax=Desulfobacula sp. TaxID=2593537 RepID=UPI001EC7CB86|nr:hypothetical protein [Desulfobacula sp.]